MPFKKTRGSRLRIIAIIAVAAAILLGLVKGPVVAADTNSDQEVQVKTAFIYNFAKFVEWPPSSFNDTQSPLTLCAIGNEPFNKALDDLKTKRVEGRPIAVKRITTIDQAEGCHVLFIAASEKGNLSQILKALYHKPILTVGDTKGYADTGVMINLISIDNKIGFEINPAPAEHASLKVSSKLLRLGKIVK